MCLGELVQKRKITDFGSTLQTGEISVYETQLDNHARLFPNTAVGIEYVSEAQVSIRCVLSIIKNDL